MQLHLLKHFEIPRSTVPLPISLSVKTPLAIASLLPPKHKATSGRCRTTQKLSGQLTGLSSTSL